MKSPFEKLRGHTLFIEGISKKPIILDLGANHGEFSNMLNTRFPGRYLLVEANPVLAETLSTETDFQVCNAAVAPKCGTVPFHIAKNDEASSLLTLPESSVYDAKVVSTVEIPGLDIDTICKEIQEPIIDLVKIDIEGAEVEVLKACSAETLERLGQITVEFHCDPSFGFELSSGTEEVRERLDRLGFVVLDFSGGNRNNVLFINRKIHRVTAVREIAWKNRLHPPQHLLRVWRALPEFLKSYVRNALRVLGVDSL
jgi:FkbM family methyltransferase